jgi:hypothetical protein
MYKDDRQVGTVALDSCSSMDKSIREREGRDSDMDDVEAGTSPRFVHFCHRRNKLSLDCLVHDSVLDLWGSPCTHERNQLAYQAATPRAFEWNHPIAGVPP